MRQIRETRTAQCHVRSIAHEDFESVLLVNGLECGCENVLMLWSSEPTRVLSRGSVSQYHAYNDPQTTSTEREHELKQQRTARAGVLVTRHLAWVGHPSGGSRSTPTVHRCPTGKAVGGSAPQNNRNTSTMTEGESRPEMRQHFPSLLLSFSPSLLLSFSPSLLLSDGAQTPRACYLRAVTFLLCYAPDRGRNLEEEMQEWSAGEAARCESA